MNKCIIFLSKNEDYFGSAKKIKDNTKLKVDIKYIEDFALINNKTEIVENSIIYFLCNSVLIKELVNLLENTCCYIFNKKFFENNYTKLEIQELLINNGIDTPRILINSNIKEMKFPVFCKENKHAGMIFEAYTSHTIERFFEKFNKKDFYIEEKINGQQEIKYYYVKGNIYSKYNIENENIVKMYCNKIAKILDLEIFSVDMIKNKNNRYTIIDVNSSAGFYLLDEARNNFINEIEKLKG